MTGRLVAAWTALLIGSLPVVGFAGTAPAGFTTALAAREAVDAVTGYRSSGSPALDDWNPGDDWDWVDGIEAQAPEDPSGEKSILTAVTASAILPGMGERYVGNKTRGYVFTGIEAAIWATFIFYEIQGNQRADRYQEFANLNAGAPLDGDADYYEHIGFWLSLEEWHDIVHRDARLRFPDDDAAQQEFFEKNMRYSQGDFWEWADDATRTRYRQLRSRSERSYRNGRMAIGAAVVNRLVSMIDSLALARRHNSAIEEEQRAHLDLRVAPRKTADGLVVGPVISARY